MRPPTGEQYNRSSNFNGHIKTVEKRTIVQQCDNWYIGRWWVGCGLLHLVQQGGAWAGCYPAQSPPRCTKCNSPPINGQCTKLPVLIKGLNQPENLHFGILSTIRPQDRKLILCRRRLEVCGSRPAWRTTWRGWPVTSWPQSAAV